VAALIGAVSYFGMPDWLPVAHPTFGAAPSDLALSFPPERQDRRTLPNGTEYFGASGTVTNVGKEVPGAADPDRAARWQGPHRLYLERHPAETLAPGESVTINEAVTDVPRTPRSRKSAGSPIDPPHGRGWAWIGRRWPGSSGKNRIMAVAPRKPLC
jgi:hypothetical protein